MSALMAERRDWSEDPRQTSLFDALAPPPETEQAPPEARIVEFPTRRDAAPAPTETEAPASAGEPHTHADEAVAAFEAAVPTEARADESAGELAQTGGLTPARDAQLDAPAGVGETQPPTAAAAGAPTGAASAFAAASEFELAAWTETPEAAAVADTTPAVAGASAIEAELVVAPEGFTGGTRTPRAVGSPLARPTLDDVMSRVWEGLSTGLPAACPVCHGELQPAQSGPRQARCSSCGTMID